jgi:hypothetical protein
MNYPLGRLSAAGLFLLLIVTPLPAQVQPEEATATVHPWSGWWWPARSGQLVLGFLYGDPGALYKHDQISGKHATDWERSTLYHFDPGGPDWWGHCHAWAAASILEPEPRREVSQGGVTFRVGDLKGLLSEAHFSDHAVFYGERFNGDPDDDFEDMYPLQLWDVLRQQILVNKLPMVFDLVPTAEVWSYPAYQYRISFQPIDEATYQSLSAAALPLEKRPGSAGLPGAVPYQGQLSLWVANFNVYPDLVGTASQQRDYTFVFRAQGGVLAPGSDHWVGKSVQDHPDFAWYPMERAQENPELDYSLVTQLVLQSR